MAKEKFNKGEIVIYKSLNGSELQVKLEKNTVWLDARLIARLFDVNRPAIVKHINNIYKTSELDKKLTCSILEQVAADGKTRKMNLYTRPPGVQAGGSFRQSRVEKVSRAGQRMQHHVKDGRAVVNHSATDISPDAPLREEELVFEL